MSKQTQQMIDKAVNEIYPDEPETSNVKKLEQIPIYKPIDMSASKKENSNVWKYIIIGVIIIIFIAIIWIVAYSYFSSSDNDETTVDTSDLDTNIGAIITDKEYYIIAGKLNKKMKEKYQLIKIANEQCPYGYYGNECQFQAHSINYYNVGSFNATYNEQNVLGQIPLSLNYSIEDGSKDKNSCTSICDGRNDCKGVIYDHASSTCSLITSDIIANGNASVDFTNSTQMYLKKSERPQFTDVIIGFSGAKILRYYLSKIEQMPDLKRTKKMGLKKKLRLGIIHFIPNQVINTIWVPYRVVNYGGFVGLFSDKEFTIDNWKNVDMLYTDNGTGEYNIPLFLQEHKNLWVLYISKEDYQK